MCGGRRLAPRYSSTRWSWSAARPARARPPSCPRSASKSAVACNGLIGHTQPRRIAARATATRISEELKSELGRHVGFKIRFTDKVTPSSYIKLMTDGILLAETQTDPLLRQYDTILIDEAHERSLNIDFLLGYLKQLLPKRRDLKVIVTSATLDAERFSKHFDQRKCGTRSSRSPAGSIRSRRASGPFDEKKDGGPERRHRRRRRRGPSHRARRRVGVPARRARNPRGGRGACANTILPSSKCCRCSRGRPRWSRAASSPRTRASAWCWRPTSPRHR
jgi:hypothetical protein